MKVNRDPIYMARAKKTFELYEASILIQRQNLRRRYPEADEEEIEKRLIAWHRHRPGAEFGDAEGRRVDPHKRGL